MRVVSLVLLLTSASAWVVCNCVQFSFKQKAPGVALWVEDGTIWVYRSSSAALAHELRCPGMSFNSILRQPLGFSSNAANGDWQARLATWLPFALSTAWAAYVWRPRRRGRYGRALPRSGRVVAGKWICLLLLVGMLTGWVYTQQQRWDYIGSNYGVSVSRGAMIVEDMNYQTAWPMPWSLSPQRQRPRGWTSQAIHEEFWGGSAHDWRRRLGLFWINGLSFDSPRFTYLPFWPAILPVAACWGLLTWIDRKRLLPGLCDHCGYDLSGNISGRCPECGTPLRLPRRDHPHQ